MEPSSLAGERKPRRRGGQHRDARTPAAPALTGLVPHARPLAPRTRRPEGGNTRARRFSRGPDPNVRRVLPVRCGDPRRPEHDPKGRLLKPRKDREREGRE